jgi:anti-sigma28 factor (negative regulator of flagellin synthesis)
MAGEDKAMRIDLNSSFLPPESTQSVKSGPRAGETGVQSPLGNDSAELSSDQLSATALTSAVAQVPEIRQEKVAALAEKLRTNAYEVSPQQTAEAIVSQMRTSQAA